MVCLWWPTNISIYRFFPLQLLLLLNLGLHFPFLPLNLFVLPCCLSLYILYQQTCPPSLLIQWVGFYSTYMLVLECVCFVLKFGHKDVKNVPLHSSQKPGSIRNVSEVIPVSSIIIWNRKFHPKQDIHGFPQKSCNLLLSRVSHYQLITVWSALFLFSRTVPKYSFTQCHHLNPFLACLRPTLLWHYVILRTAMRMRTTTSPFHCYTELVLGRAASRRVYFNTRALHSTSTPFPMHPRVLSLTKLNWINFIA